MIGVGQKFPAFKLKATVSTEPGKEFTEITNETYKGKWLVVFFWPKDFTFVCPTEIAGFGAQDGEFKSRNAQLLGASVDSEYVHLAWREHHPDLKTLPFPMMSDLKRELTSALGILDPNEGVAQRATFIVDPEGITRFIYVTDMNVGRCVDEVLRVLEAQQNGGLMPCGWHPGQPTIKA